MISHQIRDSETLLREKIIFQKKYGSDQIGPPLPTWVRQ